ncbi:MAG: septum formation protein Maf [Euryarchaeota archaeon]|nr:septum formation protein Maf [Euryarchaeota archaeon]
MTGPRLVLASASPRRRALLEALGIPFASVAANADEALPRGRDPAAAVQVIAERKVDAYLATPKADRQAFVLGVDTEVYIGGALQGKPANAKDAEAMLRRLAGLSHIVYSGLVLRAPNDERHRHTEATRVDFVPLSDAEIRSYAQTGEPLDKAGGYGVQGQGAAFIRHVEGDYTNVVGLPVRPMLRLLTQAGFPLPPHLRVS